MLQFEKKRKEKQVIKVFFFFNIYIFFIYTHSGTAYGSDLLTVIHAITGDEIESSGELPVVLDSCYSNQIRRCQQLPPNVQLHMMQLCQLAEQREPDALGGEQTKTQIQSDVTSVLLRKGTCQGRGKSN